tara:strand:+ start:143 stop:970 length:828 start_codon:yes stop_codon:yes gene_type:complete
MSKIHRKTGSNCILCDEKYYNGIIFHKTRRQTHGVCVDCGVGYLRPLIRQACNNIRKNIRKNVDKFKCPGCYHGQYRNQCKHICSFSTLNAPDCEISLDIFRLVYTLNSKNVVMCPEENCGQVMDICDYRGNKIKCVSGCQTTWCKLCLVQPYHEGKSCIEYELDNNNSENGKFINNMRRNGELKLCPQCNAPTFKHNGCNKMVCSVCNVKWCWLCKTVGIDYDHYNDQNSGTCTGRLWEGVDENGNAIQPNVIQPNVIQPNDIGNIDPVVGNVG